MSDIDSTPVQLLLSPLCCVPQARIAALRLRLLARSFVLPWFNLLIGRLLVFVSIVVELEAVQKWHDRSLHNVQVLIHVLFWLDYFARVWIIGSRRYDPEACR